LTENGVQQARQAAAWLAGRPIRRIYASPLQRASQTAQIAGQQLGLEYTIAEDLREIDCGALEGRNDVEAWESFRRVILGWFSGDLEACCQSGETGRQALERFARFMHSLPDEGDTLVVGHGGIFAWGLMQLCHDLKPTSARELYLSNASLVLVQRTPDGFSCIQWGLSDHLDRPGMIDVPEELRLGE